MAIQIQGNCGDVADVDGTTYRALKITMRPTDYGMLGQYRLSMQSGTMAAGLAAFAQIFQARWTDTPEIAVGGRVQTVRKARDPPPPGDDEVLPQC